MFHLTTRQTLLLLALIGLGLTASGFILQYGFGVIPCHMCWWQRYAHWGLAAFALLGLVQPAPQTRLVSLYPCILVSLTGLALASWMFAAQHNWLPFPASCTAATMQATVGAGDLLSAMSTAKIVPCDRETFTFLGLSLAGWNIPAMLLTTVLSAATLLRRPIK